MADRMSAEIWIGGKFPRGLLETFPISDLTLDWEENRLDSMSEEAILSARDESGLLHFADCEAAWGQFEQLEDWLREHNIPFRRQSEGKYEHSAESIEFRPDLHGRRNRNVCALTTQEGSPVVSVAEVEKITRRMARLVTDRKLSATKRSQSWERLYQKLTRILPPRVPPLPPFEIVSD